jgi:hypothetical protein
MNLLDRYLQAVRFFLPRRQQDDIVRELSENLLSQMEDRAEELGRPLSEDEQADILRRHGHPMLVAGRYRSHQRLIGPAFFPLYVVALQAGVAVALLVTIISATIASMVHGDPIRQLVAGFLAFPGRALMVFAWTTLGFAALDFAQSRLKLSHQWDPRSLPKVVKAADRLSRGRSLCEFHLSAASTVWLLLAPWAPWLFLGPAAAYVEPAPIWRLAYVPVLLLSVAGTMLSFINLTRPYWTPARSLMRAGIHVGTFLISANLLRAGEWVVATDGGTLPSGASPDQLVRLINMGFQIGLSVAMVVSVIELLREVHRMRSGRRNHANGTTTAHV